MEKITRTIKTADFNAITMNKDTKQFEKIPFRTFNCSTIQECAKVAKKALKRKDVLIEITQVHEQLFTMDIDTFVKYSDQMQEKQITEIASENSEE